MSLKEEVKRREELAGRQREQDYLAKVMPQIFSHWPEIADNTANRNMIVEFCGSPFAVDIAAVELCLQNETPSGLIHRLAVASVDQQKVKLIDQICRKLEGKQSPNPTNDAHIVQNKRKQMTFWSLGKLRERLRQVEETQDLAGKPISDLRSIVRQSVATLGYPKLPREIVRPGTVRSVPLDAAYIRRLDREELKKLIRIYSADEINRRLRGE